jgi:HAD-hyrolase-like protein
MQIADCRLQIAAYTFTAMVGDSDADIAAAQSARVASIGVATGVCSTSRLLMSGATWVFPALTELHAWLSHVGSLRQRRGQWREAPSQRLHDEDRRSVGAGGSGSIDAISRKPPPARPHRRWQSRGQTGPLSSPATSSGTCRPA